MLLEEGTIAFHYRPRVEELDPQSVRDVQRLLIETDPTDNDAYGRILAIGRKRLPPSTRHTRFWGFVDVVLPREDLPVVLGPQVYATKTRGLRHLPPTRPAGRGTYTVEWHDTHAHLRWTITDRPDDPVVADLALEDAADYIVTVANPDPLAWGLVETPPLQDELFDELEVHVTIPTPFPPTLQSRFGQHRYAQLDTTEWLDHPGAELVFIGSGE